MSKFEEYHPFIPPSRLDGYIYLMMNTQKKLTCTLSNLLDNRIVDLSTTHLVAANIILLTVLFYFLDKSMKSLLPNLNRYDREHVLTSVYSLLSSVSVIAMACLDITVIPRDVFMTRFTLPEAFTQDRVSTPDFHTHAASLFAMTLAALLHDAYFMWQKHGLAVISFRATFHAAAYATAYQMGFATLGSALVLLVNCSEVCLHLARVSYCLNVYKKSLLTTAFAVAHIATWSLANLFLMHTCTVRPILYLRVNQLQLDSMVFLSFCLVYFYWLDILASFSVSALGLARKLSGTESDTELKILKRLQEGSLKLTNSADKKMEEFLRHDIKDKTSQHL